jgi:hypothetical protein
MRFARKIELSSEDRAVLEQQARGRSHPARLVERSRTVLLAAAGLQNREIAAQLGIIKRWLERHRRFHVHFTPTGCSWLNKVERFFRDLTDKQLRRGVFRNVEELL